MPFAVNPDQQAVGHIARKLPADISTGAEAHALVLDLIVGLVFDVAKAQRAGIEFIFVSGGRRANDRAVKLGMLADPNIEAALARKDARLFLHRVIVAVHFVLTQVRRRAERAEAAADARAGV